MSPCPGCGTAMSDSAAPCPECGTIPASRLVTRAAAEGMVRPEPETAGLRHGAVVAGRYRILEPLGHGGMGEVFRAEDTSLGQMVALKLLPARLAGDPGALERVREEVRVSRLVTHPNVCRIHDLGEFEGQPFISMEYVDGEDLATLLRRVGRLAGDRALAVARELCAGLAAAHASGVVHRDLKPANVMLDRRGRVRITDFGLAVLESAAQAEVAGTPGYMAPEQLAGAGASVRSDLYALGLVLYEVFTGHRAFPAASVPELLRARREAPTAAMRDLAPELDPAVERAVLRCLSPRVEDRPGSSLEVLTELTGGDPLKAALEAGQTPSPSAVAAASPRGVLSAPAAWACLLAILGWLVLSLSPAARLVPIARNPLPFPPSVLAVKAEEAMRDLGHERPCLDRASGFGYDGGAVRLAAARSGPHRKVEAAAAVPRMVVFWHRCSPRPLIPRGPTGRVETEDPALQPGEGLAVLDTMGRLREFRTSPPEVGGSSAEADPLATFARLAGLEAPGPGTTMGDLVRRTSHLEGGVPVTLEARVVSGTLLEARLVPPWAPPAPPPARVFQASDVFDLFLLAAFLVSLPLALRNARSGRVDRSGAWRVGTVVFVLRLASLILRAHAPATIGAGVQLVTQFAAWSLFHGATTSLLYLALEPFVRRVSPDSLVSWSRLLSGGHRDPMVARDILVGLAAFSVSGGAVLVPLMLSGEAPILPLRVDAGSLLGLDVLAGGVAWALAFTVRTGLGFFLCLLIALRAFGRTRWLAPAAFFGFAFALTVANVRGMGGSLPLAVLGGVTSAAAWLFLVTRFGLLALTANAFARALALVTLAGTGLTGWAAAGTWCFAGIVLSLGVYGLVVSTGGRPFGERGLLEA